MKIKKIFAILLAVLTFALLVTGCSKTPIPTVKEGKFNFSVTYEVDGEEETVSSVCVCKFVKLVPTLEGAYREGDSHIEDSTLSAKLEKTRGYLLLKTTADGEIYLDLNLSAEYFMADPNFWITIENTDEPVSDISPRLFIDYNAAKYEEIGESYSEDAAVLESYGVKIIRYEYDAPIENEYK